MNQDQQQLLDMLQNKNHPDVLAAYLNQFVFAKLRKQEISFYESFQLEQIVFQCREASVFKPAWSMGVGISNCIELLNMYLVALVFEEKKYAQYLKEKAPVFLESCGEKRNHYIMNHYLELFECNVSSLKILSHIRKEKDKNSFEAGPYHYESYPEMIFEPEEILLKGGHYSKGISENITDFVVELGLMVEEKF